MIGISKKLRTFAPDYYKNMSKIGDFFTRLTKKVPEGHGWETAEYHSGMASYCYIMLGDTKIFDGEFKFKRPFATGFDKAEGTFERDKKEGEWYFERKSSRNNKKMYAKFERGHVRELELVNDDYSINFLARTTLTLTIDENDHVVGDIQGVIEGGNFIGHCDEDGFPDGLWSLRTQDENGHDTEERETWKHGRQVMWSRPWDTALRLLEF